MKQAFLLIRNLFRHIKESVSLNMYDGSSLPEWYRKRGAEIGEHVHILSKKLADELYLVKIGNNVYIEEGVTLITHDGASIIFRDEIPNLQYFGKITVGDNCFIGSNAIIMAGVTIGNGSIVSPFSVVINNMPPNSLVQGNPARRISSVEEFKKLCISR